eukprot:jgi/Mesvir1/1887/Mv22917-RA.1
MPPGKASAQNPLVLAIDDKVTEVGASWGVVADREHDELEQLFDSDKCKAMARWARIVSWVSLWLTFFAGVLGLIAALVFSSAATLGYALEAFVDMFSSVLVLWRFRFEDEDETVSARANASRERRASVGIAVALIFISILVGVKAMLHIVNGIVPDRAVLLQLLSTVSIISMSLLAAVKYYIAAMQNDAHSSLAVVFMSIGVLASAAVHHAYEHIWFLDSAVALVVSAALMLCGARTLAGARWWDAEFWRAPSDEI